MNYYISKTVNLPFDETFEKVTNDLKKYGFGIVTTLDADKVLKEKIGAELKPYKILGACNPNFAYQAITNEPMIGTLLPCNVLVRYISENQTEVAAINPISMFSLIGKAEFEPIVNHVQTAFEELIELL